MSPPRVTAILVKASTGTNKVTIDVIQNLCHNDSIRVRSLSILIVYAHQNLFWRVCYMKEDQILFRRATSDDNLLAMARLLYESDDFVYPYWKEDESGFAKFLEPWMNVDGFIFNFHNFYIAHQRSYRYPLAIMVTIDNRMHYDFDYDIIRRIDNENAFIVDHYLQNIADDCEILPDDVARMVALCVNPTLRGRGIGSGLFEYGIANLKRRGIKNLYFDCPADNHVARCMYEKHGFEVVDHSLGFDGTENSQRKIVTYFAGGFQ